MSIIKLLSDFPNYSARKVRRLAKQISKIQQLAGMVAMGEESGLLKGIEADLIEYNLLQAKTEERLNDDLAQPVVTLSPPKKVMWWGHETILPDTLEESHEWIIAMLEDWLKVANNMGFDDFQDPEVIIEKAKECNK